MKGIIFSIYFLIKIHYPNNDINTIRYYNKLVDDAVKEYCFLDIDYDIANSNCNDYDVDLWINQYDFDYINTLGTTTGMFIYNKRVFGTPFIKLSAFLNKESEHYIMTHEMGHFLGLQHSPDTLSLMYPFYRGSNKKLSRQDSIYLGQIYSQY